MLASYELIFNDDFTLVFIGTYEEMLQKVDKLKSQHGNCRSCEKILRYDRYTGRKTEKIW